MNNENELNPPVLDGYTKIPTFKLWVANRFPYMETDFDGITNYELLEALTNYLNNVIKNEENVESNVAKLNQAYLELLNYVKDYFKNLDVQEEINNKLDDLVEDGTLERLIGAYINPLIEAQNQEISELKSQVNGQIAGQNAQIQALESGSPLAAGSVSQMTDTTRVYVNTTDGNWYYYNGTQWVIGGVYQSSVDVVATNIIELTSNLRPFLSQEDYSRATLSNSGELVNSTTRIATTEIQHFDKPIKLIPRDGYKIKYFLFDENLTHNNVWVTDIEEPVFIPNNAYFRLCIWKEDESEILPSEYEALLYEELPEILYSDFYEKNFLDRVTWFVTTQQYYYPAVKMRDTNRAFSLEYLKCPYDVTLVNNSDDKGITVYIYDDNYNYIREISGWDGKVVTPSIIIPANTIFRIYVRKLDNSSFGTPKFKEIKLDNQFSISINTMGIIEDEITDIVDDEMGNIYKYKTDNIANVFGKSSTNLKRLSPLKLIDIGNYGFQSSCINLDKEEIYILKDSANTRIDVYSLTGKFKRRDNLTGNYGHGNDSCYYNGKIYTVNTDNAKILSVIDLDTLTVQNIDLTGKILDKENADSRKIGAVCETYHNSGELYIVCDDLNSSNPLSIQNNMLSIYKYNIENDTCQLLKEYEKDFVFVQGATCIDGYLYINCNIMTTGQASNYKGIEIKVINMTDENMPLIDKYQFEGFFEGEGLDYIYENDIPKIYMGMCHYEHFGYLVKFVAPY